MRYSRIYDKIPNSSEKIAVDTNIMYWVFYADDNCLIDDKPYQIPTYSECLKNVMENGNEIIVFGGVLLELFKIIERNEYKIYLHLNQVSENDLSLKAYRKNEEERKLVKEKLDITYKQIQQVASICYETINSQCCEAFIDEFDVHKADFIDFSLLRLCKSHSIKNIITDDADFKTVSSDINIISGNRSFFK